MFRVCLSPAFGLGRQVSVIKLRPSEVQNTFANRTDKMMMMRGVRVESSLIFEKVDLGDETKLVKCGQGSVYRVERYGRKPGSHPLKHLFGGRMVRGLDDLEKHLHALGRYLDPVLLTNAFQNFNFRLSGLFVRVFLHWRNFVIQLHSYIGIVPHFAIEVKKILRFFSMICSILSVIGILGCA
jgi:hypothetical protein